MEVWVLLLWLQDRADRSAVAMLDAATRRNWSTVLLGVYTLGHLFASHVSPTHAQDRAQIGKCTALVQAVTGEHVTLVFVDQGCTGRRQRRQRQTTASRWRGEARSGKAWLRVVVLPLGRRTWLGLDDAVATTG